MAGDLQREGLRGLVPPAHGGHDAEPIPAAHLDELLAGEEDIKLKITTVPDRNQLIMSLISRIAALFAVAEGLRARGRAVDDLRANASSLGEGAYTFDDFVRDNGRAYKAGSKEYAHRAAVFLESLSQIRAQNARAERSWTAMHASVPVCALYAGGDEIAYTGWSDSWLYALLDTAGRFTATGLWVSLAAIVGPTYAILYMDPVMTPDGVAGDPFLLLIGGIIGFLGTI